MLKNRYKNFFSLLFLFVCIVCSCQVQAQQVMPHLWQKSGTTQLIVNGAPYLMLGGELGNSTASDLDYLQTVWPKVTAMHVNTVLAPVYWELIEKKKGQFNFSLVDGLIHQARKHDVKLVLLWFGSWKNSMSSYVPGWVKKNTEKYPRAKDKKGNSYEILSPFYKNNLQADKRAFVKLMQHLKKVDSKQHTVLMVQVENEVGMMPMTRGYSAKARKAFKQPVPAKLMTYMQKHKNSLSPILYKAWKKQGFKTSGTWQEVFGKGLDYALTDQIFMAWYYGKYINAIAKAGKEVYSLPMYVNAALYRPNEKAGIDYATGAPLPFVMDIWKAAAPAINFMSPDIYLPNYKHWCDLYARPNNPLFIPELHFNDVAAAKAFYAFGHYGAIGFSPFSIESTSVPHKEPLGKAYNILSQLAPLIVKNYPEGKVEGVLLNQYHWRGLKMDRDTAVVKLGKYKFTFRRDPFFHPKNSKNQSAAGAVIIQTAPNTFFIGGTGIAVTFEVRNSDNKNAGILRIDEGKFVNGNWQAGRRMNGDQSNQGRFLRIPMHDFAIQHLELYVY